MLDKYPFYGIINIKVRVTIAKGEKMSRKKDSEWSPEKIKSALKANDRQLCRAIIAIYDLQTQDEKRWSDTCESNGVGFNSADAEILSSFALFYTKTGFLTSAQIKLARKKMSKYAGQLSELVYKKRAVSA